MAIEVERGPSRRFVNPTTGIAAIPTASTAITASPAMVRGIILSNPTASGVDVTIRAGGVAGTIVGVITVAAKSTTVFPISNNGDGIYFPTGLSWNAASSGLFADYNITI